MKPLATKDRWGVRRGTMDLGSVVGAYCEIITVGGQTPKRIVLFALLCLVLVTGWVRWEHTGRMPGVIVLGGVPFLLFLAALVC